MKKKAKKIKVIIVEPGKPAYVKEVKDELETYQEIVGGLIEIVRAFDDGVILVDNEEGKLMGLPLNRKIKELESPLDIFWEDLKPNVIAGTFIITSLGGDNSGFASLSPEETEKYLKRFAIPEEY